MENKPVKAKRDWLGMVTRFLSEVIEDDGQEMRDRLKASELLAKTAPPDEGVSAIEVRVDYGGGA